MDEQTQQKRDLEVWALPGASSTKVNAHCWSPALTWGLVQPLGKGCLDYGALGASGATTGYSTKGRRQWPLAGAPRQEDLHGDVC